MQLNIKLADKQKTQIIKLALSEILEGVVFSANGNEVTDADIPHGVFRIGELADKIESAQLKNILVKKIVANKIEIDVLRKTATSKKKEAQLTEIEVKIINYMEANKIATREELLQKVWGYSAEASTRTVETHIHRLNQKIQENFGCKIIENTKSGYRLI